MHWDSKYLCDSLYCSTRCVTVWKEPAISLTCACRRFLEQSEVGGAGRGPLSPHQLPCWNLGNGRYFGSVGIVQKQSCVSFQKEEPLLVWLETRRALQTTHVVGSWSGILKTRVGLGLLAVVGQQGHAIGMRRPSTTRTIHQILANARDAASRPGFPNHGWDWS